MNKFKQWTFVPTKLHKIALDVVHLTTTLSVRHFRLSELTLFIYLFIIYFLVIYFIY
jgi:hypothetical protein